MPSSGIAVVIACSLQRFEIDSKDLRFQTSSDGLDRPFSLLPTTAVSDGESRRGDVDGDGAVDITDVVTLLRHTVRLAALDAQQKVRADVNRNSAVDVGDAVGILRIITGIGV